MQSQSVEPSMHNSSIMAKEAASSPEIIQAQLLNNAKACEALARQLRDFPPRAIMMIGRGTSDHAGVFAKYLFEVGCQVPVIAAAPSVAGIYNSCLKLEGCMTISISQSGKSPDILQQTRLAKKGGAFTLALVNDENSPLAALCDAVLPLKAGEEKAVAATKSYLSTLSALAQLFAFWQQDSELQHALEQLGPCMARVRDYPAQLKNESLSDVAHCVVLGRGFGYAIAREVALKLKEVLGIHAEAFSSAEFLHGPVTLVHKKLCVLDICVEDESAQGHKEQIKGIVERGGRVVDISVHNSTHPRLHALLIMQRFYLDLEAIAIERGLDPDSPIGLKKVTQTV